MRKMTKTAVTLAAMSAMTVAAASMAFAAEDRPNITSVADEKQVVDTSGSGKWIDDGTKGWKFELLDGTKMKDQWAEIDGVWYYFKGEYIYQNRFVTMNDKDYFFDKDGRLATGWQKIDTKMDAYQDLYINERLYSYMNTYELVNEDHEYDYHDFVWCYFDEHGVALEDTWFHDPASGLWYYFDGNVMVKNMYDYEVDPANNDGAMYWDTRYYGFDENGAMLVGWNYKKLKKNNNTPVADEANKVWYYYKPNGQMQKAGWAQIDDKWYLFANTDADGRNNGEAIYNQDKELLWSVRGYPMLVNSYVASYANEKATTPEYFYVNSKGELTSGVQNVKKAYKIVFYPKGSAGNEKDVRVAYEKKEIANSDIYVNFAKKNYAAEEGVVDNSYYTMHVLKDNKEDGAVQIVKAKFGNKEDSLKKTDGIYDAISRVNKTTGETYAFKGVAADETDDVWRFTDTGRTAAGTMRYYYGYPNITDADQYAVETERYNPDNRRETEIGLEYEKYDYTLGYNDQGAAQLVIEGAAYAVSANNAATTYLGKLREYVEAENAYNDYLKDTIAVSAVSGYKTFGVTIDEIDGEEIADMLAAIVVTGAPTAPITGVLPVTRYSEGGVTDVWSVSGCEAAIKEYQGRLDKGDSSTAVSGVSNGDYLRATVEVLEMIQEAVKAQLNDIIEERANALIYEDPEDVETITGQAKVLTDAAKVAKDDMITAKNDYLAARADVIKYAKFWTPGKDDNIFVDADSVGTQVAKGITVYDFTVVGERVKDAFIGRTKDLYLADTDGKLVVNRAVRIGDDANYNPTGYNSLLEGRYDNIYIVFGPDGKAVRGYEGTKKSIRADGNVTYWATTRTIKLGDAEATIFISNQKVAGKR